jgi:hypothetical protein
MVYSNQLCVIIYHNKWISWNYSTPRNRFIRAVGRDSIEQTTRRFGLDKLPRHSHSLGHESRREKGPIDFVSHASFCDHTLDLPYDSRK